MVAQDDWMTALDAAKRLALAQDKMLLMAWEESTFYPLPVLIENDKGEQRVIQNLFESYELIDILWESFVLVKVNEQEYAEWYENIHGKMNLSYMDKFNDDSLKVVDVNGNILNVSYQYSYVLNLNDFIVKYSLNTSFLKQELLNYREDKSFYPTFYLASKYIDYAFYVNQYVRPEIIDLSSLYLNEARALLENEEIENEEGLRQRIELLETEQSLVLNKPKKVLRRLNRVEESEVQGANKPLYAFLYYTAYSLLGDEENASPWHSKVSFLDLDKVKYILTSN